MRLKFIQTLADLAQKDKRIVLLTADCGYTVLELFAQRFADRFFNVGVAEQNMIGMATGLAEAGFIPFCYSMASFVSMRPFEFIRNGPVLHNLPVRIIGIGAGFDYGHSGITHFGLEDIGILRTLPGLRIIVPVDDCQAQKALIKTWDLPGPIYYRLSKTSQPACPGFKGCFKATGELDLIQEGTDILLIGVGPMANLLVRAASQLHPAGISATIVALTSVVPFNKATFINLIQGFKVALIVEEHLSVGGAGAMLAEIMAENNIRCRLVRHAVDKIPSYGGTPDFLRKSCGISSQTLVKCIQRLVG